MSGVAKISRRVRERRVGNELRKDARAICRLFILICRFDGKDFGKGVKEYREYMWVERDARLFLHMCEGFVDGPSVFVGANGGECIKAVGDGDDATYFGDIEARELVGVPRAVPFFVVCLGDDLSHLNNGGLGVGKELSAAFGVGFHDIKLFWGQLSWFKEDAIGDGYFSDIVHGGCIEEVVELFGGIAEVAGNDAAVFTHTGEVIACFVVAIFGCTCETREGFAMCVVEVFVGVAEFLGAAGYFLFKVFVE